MNNRVLFCGALFAAVLSAGAAAQTFQITGGFADTNYIAAELGDARTFDIGADFWDETESVGSAFAHSFSNPTTIANYAYSGDTGHAYVIHFLPTYFEVTADTTVTLSWDFQGDLDGPGGAYADSFFQIYNSDGVFVLVDLSNPVGSMDLTMEAGENYFFIGQALATGGDDQVSSWSLVIPAPASAPLLGLAGFGLLRRRRRQN